MVQEPADETWLETPGPAPDTSMVRERLDVTPVEEWTDQQLVDDFQARDTGATLLAQAPVEVEPAVGSGLPPGGAPDKLPEVDPSPVVDPEQPEGLAPQRVDGEDPEYPRLSARLKEQGDVVLRLTLDEEGRVRGVELVESSGYIRLDEAAMSAAPKWRFDLTPEGALRRFEHTVHFQLAR